MYFSFFFQAEDGIRDCLLSRGLGDVYKRQTYIVPMSNNESRVSSASSMDSDVIEKPHEKENSLTETELIYPPITSLPMPPVITEV